MSFTDKDGDIGLHFEGLMKGLISKTQKETSITVVARLERIEGMMAKIQLQNQEMMAKMQLQNQLIIDIMTGGGPTPTPEELPESPKTCKVECDCEEDLGILENKLMDGAFMEGKVRNLKTVEVNDAKKHTKAILSRLLTKDLASKYTWTGTIDKKPFKDFLVNKLVQMAVRRNPNHWETTDEQIKVYTRQWLSSCRKSTPTPVRSCGGSTQWLKNPTPVRIKHKHTTQSGSPNKKPKPSPRPPTNTSIYITTPIITPIINN